MRPEQISGSLNHLSDEILEETDQVRSQKQKRKWPLWTAAACLCVILAGTILLPRLEQKGPGGLPLLEVSMESGGMGFEGLLHYDFSELENGNPWHEGMELEALPVFRNGAYSEVGEPIGLSAKELEQRAESAARALGIEDFTIEQERGSYVASSIARVRLTGEGVRIDAEADGCVTVWFDDELALPEEYRFEYSDITSQEANAVLDYLIGQYAMLLNFQQPQKAVFRDYNIYEELGVDYRVYDAAGDDVEDILNYAFRQADFAPDGEGNLMLIRLYDGLACAEQMGDYPLISLEEAREALLAGQYVTTVPYDFPGEEKVYGGELVYRGSAREQVFIPYYRFYVDLSHEFPNRDNGLKDFGAYYVPAVEHQYLKPGWQWDGSFN